VRRQDQARTAVVEVAAAVSFYYISYVFKNFIAYIFENFNNQSCPNDWISRLWNEHFFKYSVLLFPEMGVFFVDMKRVKRLVKINSKEMRGWYSLTFYTNFEFLKTKKKTKINR